MFYNPSKAELSPDGSFLLVADMNNQLIRRIDVSSASVTTLAGEVAGGGYADGQGSNALFLEPSDVAIDQSGDVAYIVRR